MDASKLVLMLGNIERNIPAREDAAAKIAAHLDSFWSPAMRQQMYQHMVTHREDFSDTVQAALDTLHSQAKA